MTNQRAASRNSNSTTGEGGAAVPKIRGKSKGRVRGSPFPRKSNGLSTPKGASTPGTSGHLPSVTSGQTHPNKPPPHSQQRNSIPATPPPKRTRPPSLSREPDPKRVKGMNDLSGSINGRMIGKPTSPTTSSRSRKGKNRRWDGEASSGSGIAAQTTTTNYPPVRMRASKMRSNHNRNAPSSSANLVFAPDANGIIPPPRPTALPNRLFGPEIQSIMHACGEVRFCARPVLEMVEDAARDVVLRAAKEAVDIADGSKVTIDHISIGINKDIAAIQRLNKTLKSFQDEKREQGQPSISATLPRKIQDWIYDLSYLTDEPARVERRYHMIPNVETIRSYRAMEMCKVLMKPSDFEYLRNCREVTLIRDKSSSSALKNTAGRFNRFDLFKEWIGLKHRPNVNFSDEVIVALGHLAWEAVGNITQTALMVKHFNDSAEELLNPRSINWTHPRHVITALGHGLIAALMVPLSEHQVMRLINEIVELVRLRQVGANIHLRENDFMSSQCLTPANIREALRLLQVPRDQVGQCSINKLFTQGLSKC